MQEAQSSGIKDLLEKQQESEKAYREHVLAATVKLDAENRSLTERCRQQEEVLQRQQQQFDECSATISQAKNVSCRRAGFTLIWKKICV